MLFSQSSGSISTEISVKLIKGLGSELINGDLNFGDVILSGSPASLNKNPNEGILFKLNGHPNKEVVLS